MRPPRKPTSWLEDIPRRWAREADARRAYPDFRFHRRQRPGGLVYTYDATVDVPGYEPRRVRIEFRPRLPGSPRVFVDGPAGPDSSPHRYADRRLCVWYPGDDPARLWVPKDGLLALFGMVSAHLFKEAYWRETGEWLGDEAPHSAWETDEDAHDEPRRRRTTT